ncbi:MAG: PTS IIA-like nitrogen regulatory protein PtsN [Alphaproteobacteria bacterium]|jgi:nitrogen PTS system EIIA component|uniref:PTS IIA-like nitrogen regulatory protein PtsN n=1 Tax=Maricaulis alexandrii TaxID=2570354 RepID=UPI0011095133|nr:PTS IIA-like nitrogen regulatory protein PtsN [Maricaulis alexandrii]MCR9266059.1 PTS IIA-like nitrogen regulatory protein PtsN [Alphaproteobacteria bacterium]
MALSDLIPNGGVAVDLGASSRKQALQAMSDIAADLTGLAPRDIFDAVLQRERLGSTGVGQGVAIPHARLAGVDEVVGVFARLRSPVDFESIDGRPADLIFMLIAPEDAGAEHLKALARVSRLLRREDVRQRLRAAPDADAIHAVLAGEPASDAA